jgi:PAS domain S-box-containing protein
MSNLPLLLDEGEATALLLEMANFAGPVARPPGEAAPAAASEADPTTKPKKGWQPDLRYRSLVEKLPVVTFMAGLNDSLQELYISPQIESLLGFTQDEWLENPFLWFRQLHPEDRDRWCSEFARTCATGAHFRAEYRLLARDGRVWIQGECQVIRDETGRPAYLQGIALEIEQAGVRGDAGLVQRHLGRLAAEARHCADYIPKAMASMSKMTELRGET